MTEKAMSNIVKAQAHPKKIMKNSSIQWGSNEALLQEVKNKACVGGKFDTRYTGLYTIMDEVRKGVYRFERDGKPLEKIINGSRLK